MNPIPGIVVTADGAVAFDWTVEWEVTHARALAIRELHEAEYRAALATVAPE